MFEFSFERPSGKRVLKGVFGRGVCADQIEGGHLWWDITSQAWVGDPSGDFSSHHDVRLNSFKAFKRYLRKRKDLHANGFVVVLVPKYKPNDSCGEYTIKAKFVEEVK